MTFYLLLFQNKRCFETVVRDLFEGCYSSSLEIDGKVIFEEAHTVISSPPAYQVAIHEKYTPVCCKYIYIIIYIYICYYIYICERKTNKSIAKLLDTCSEGFAQHGDFHTCHV